MQHASGALRFFVSRPQYAEPAGLDRFQPLAALAAFQPILTIAEKGEMAIFHPLEQRAGLAEFSGIDARAHRTQILCGGSSRGAHAAPIRAGRAHVAQTALDLSRQRFKRRGIDDSIDFDMLEGFEPLFRAMQRLGSLLQRI